MGEPLGDAIPRNLAKSSLCSVIASECEAILATTEPVPTTAAFTLRRSLLRPKGLAMTTDGRALRRCHPPESCKVFALLRHCERMRSNPRNDRTSTDYRSIHITPKFASP